MKRIVKGAVCIFRLTIGGSRLVKTKGLINLWLRIFPKIRGETTRLVLPVRSGIKFLPAISRFKHPLPSSYNLLVSAITLKLLLKNSLGIDFLMQVQVKFTRRRFN